MIANNEVSFDEQRGIVNVAYRGDQTASSLRAIEKPQLDAVHKLTQSGRKVLFLIDATRVGSTDSGARKAGAEILAKYSFHKMAVVTKSLFIRYLGRIFFSALGSKPNGIVKYFDDERKAVNWLLEQKD